jgi:Cu2+-exporting ATPase
VPAPFGLRDDVWLLVLRPAGDLLLVVDLLRRRVAGLRARTLDMMVLVAVAVGAGLAYSVGVTLTGGGEGFYEAASVLPRSCCSGTGSKCARRGGANDAIRALLELAHPAVVLIRDGNEL